MYNRDIKITSYNYEKTIEADPETAIEMHISTIKEHSFLLFINNIKYELRKSTISTDYQISTMEDELYEEKGHVSDSIYIHFKSNDQVITITNKEITDNINEFIDNLIQEVEKNKIGCTEENHFCSNYKKTIMPKDNNELLLKNLTIPDELANVILYTEQVQKEQIQDNIKSFLTKSKRSKTTFKFD